MSEDQEAAVQEAVNHLISLLEHPGFKIMQWRLDADKKKALESLCEADAENAPEIRRLQEVVARANYYFNTVEELIQQGLTSEDLESLEEPVEDDGTYTDDHDSIFG